MSKLCVMSVLVIVLLIAPVFMTVAKVPEVMTTHGRVEGTTLRTLIRDTQYYGFMGIPFARPPVNDLRFLPPQPIKSWDGVLKATKEKQACVQYNTNIKKGQSLGVYGSEDCLYLDIFTPDLDQNKRPVIVFVYNENFAISHNKTKDYTPDFFIEENVLIVTISHRLSVFGFLSLEDESVPGNSGLKDIVEGLKWIKNNIEHFGGDRNKITLMGVQGGAAAVDLLIHSNARELFNSAILQSGSALSTACLQEGARQRAFELGKILKFSTSSPTNLVSFLRNLTPVKLLSRDIHASPKDYFKETQRGIQPFGPIVERQSDGLITEYPEKSTNDINMPVMIGFNSREGLESSFQYLIEPRYLTYVDKDFPFMMPVRLNFKLDPVHEDFYKAIDDIKNFYFRSSKVHVKDVAEYISYIGDVAISYNVDYTAKMYSNKSSNPVYYYYFDYYSELNENKNNIMKLSTVEEGTWGAASGDELCYLFKCPSLKEAYLRHHKSLSEENNIRIKMVRMWANFAKYGDPTPDDDTLLEGFKWPHYKLDTKQYLHIDKTLEIKSNLYQDRFEFWDQFIFKWGSKSKLITESKNKNDEL